MSQTIGASLRLNLPRVPYPLHEQIAPFPPQHGTTLLHTPGMKRR
jgi:hypothetical protein